MASRVAAAANGDPVTFESLEKSMAKLVPRADPEEEVDATDDEYDEESAECGADSSSDSEGDFEWASSKRVNCMDLSQLSRSLHEREEEEEDKPVTRSRLSCGFGHAELQYLMSKLSTYEGEEFGSGEDNDDDASQDDSFDGRASERQGTESEDDSDGDDEGVPERVDCIDLPHPSLVLDDRTEHALMRSAVTA